MVNICAGASADVVPYVTIAATLLECVLNTAAAAGMGEVTLVLGHSHERDPVLVVLPNGKMAVMPMHHAKQN